jgi:hypothetical protein
VARRTGAVNHAEGNKAATKPLGQLAARHEQKKNIQQTYQIQEDFMAQTVQDIASLLCVGFFIVSVAMWIGAF